MCWTEKMFTVHICVFVILTAITPIPCSVLVEVVFATGSHFYDRNTVKNLLFVYVELDL